MFSWNFPYPSQRMPVLARNVVATSQPLAAQAGLDAMARGGNAVDAAVATAITLAVVEPTMNGIGSDAFGLVWNGERLYGLNGSGRSPAAWTRERFAGMEEMPNLGWDAVTVPGCVSAWKEMSSRFGRLPFADLFESAIRYASDGFLVAPVTAAGWKQAEARFAGMEEFERVFLPRGRAPKAGERWASADHARTLEEIAETDGESFYRGGLAAKIAACARDGRGAMVEEDLASHRSGWVEPVSARYRGYTLHEIPPNGQGLASLIALGILEHFDLEGMGADSPDSLHVQAEAMKLALADAYQYISDPDTLSINIDMLLDGGYLKERASSIQMDKAASPVYGVPRGGTVLLAAADESGMMVSFIQSNFWGFGSGVVVPKTGIALQNRGSGFSLKRGHANEAGPGKRPFHTIIPGFVTRDGEPLMAFGMMGGSIQAQGHTQIMVRIADYHQNPQAASDAPRWRVLEGRRLALEKGHGPQCIDDLGRRGHDVVVMDSTAFGGAQLIYKLEGGYCAASDHRKDGQAVGR